MQTDLLLAGRIVFWTGFAFLFSPVVIAIVKVTARLIVRYD